MQTNNSTAEVMRPSNSEMWTRCPYSVKILKEEENKKTEPILDGIMAHALAEKSYTEKKNPTDFIGEYIGFDVYDNSRKKKEEMSKMVDNSTADVVSRYLEYINSFVKEKNTVSKIETQLDLSNWLPGEAKGTCDFFSYCEDEGVINIFDLKMGRVEVKAENNSQLMLYALGVYKLLGEPEKVEKITLHIFQRDFSDEEKDKISIWSTTKGKLLIFGDYVKDRASKCMEEKPAQVAGSTQCKYCAGKRYCSAYYQSTIKPVFDTIEKNFITKDFRKLIIEQGADIKKFIDDVKDETVEEFKNGYTIEGYALKEGNKVRVWADNAEEFLVNELGVNNAYKTSLITITEATKKMKANKKVLPDNIFNHRQNKATIIKIKKEDDI